MRAVLLSLLIVLGGAIAPTARAAPTASPSVPTYYLDADPAAFVAAAFATDYGQLLVLEFASVLGDSADHECLAAKGIDHDQLIERARAILVFFGAQAIT